MKYLLLIYSNEQLAAQIPPAEWEKVFQEYGQVSAELAQAGALQAGEALQPISTATTVRVKDGKTLITDGPFAETKEQLGGFYMIDAPDLDAATAWAAKIPGAKYGCVEVRPIMVFSR